MSEHEPIHILLARVLGELPAIGKNQRNQQQGFNFRGIDDVLNALNPLLAKHGVFFVPDVLEMRTSERTTSKGNALYTVHMHVRYTFYGPNGDTLTTSGWGEGTDSGDKATSKAMMMAMKYVLFQVLAISTEEQSAADADGHTAPETVRRDQAIRALRDEIAHEAANRGLEAKGLAEKFAEHYGHPTAQAEIAELSEFLAAVRGGSYDTPPAVDVIPKASPPVADGAAAEAGEDTSLSSPASAADLWERALAADTKTAITKLFGEVTRLGREGELIADENGEMQPLGVYLTNKLKKQRVAS